MKTRSDTGKLANKIPSFPLKDAVQLGIRYVVETKNAALIGLYAVKQAVAPL